MKKVIQESNSSEINQPTDDKQILGEQMKKDLLPTHSLGLGTEIPDSLPKGKESSITGGAEKSLPTHPSDAAAQIPDHLGEKKAKEVAMESEDKKDDEKEEMKESSHKEDDKEEMKEAKEDMEKEMEEAVSHLMKKDEEEKDSDDKKKDMKEHIEILTSNQELSEDAKTQISVIFETAVATQVAKDIETHRQKLSAAYNKVFAEKFNSLQETLVANVEGYLEQIAEEFVTENAAAIEKSIKSELSEGLISGIKSLLEKHFVEVPETKRDLVKELSEEKENLAKELDAAKDVNSELLKKIQEGEKKSLIEAATKGLTTLEAEKLKALAETVSFESADEFSKKLGIIKESYKFGNETVASKDLDTGLVEEGGVQQPEASKESDEEMDHYAQAISKLIKL